MSLLKNLLIIGIDRKDICILKNMLNECKVEFTFDNIVNFRIKSIFDDVERDVYHINELSLNCTNFLRVVVGYTRFGSIDRNHMKAIYYHYNRSNKDKELFTVFKDILVKFWSNEISESLRKKLSLQLQKFKFQIDSLKQFGFFPEVKFFATYEKFKYIKDAFDDTIVPKDIFLSDLYSEIEREIPIKSDYEFGYEDGLDDAKEIWYEEENNLSAIFFYLFNRIANMTDTEYMKGYRAGFQDGIKTEMEISSFRIEIQRAPQIIRMNDSWD